MRELDVSKAEIANAITMIELQRFETLTTRMNRAAIQMHYLFFHKHSEEHGYCGLWGSTCNGNWIQRQLRKLKARHQSLASA